MTKVNIRFNAAICKIEGLNSDIVEAIKSRFRVELTEERYQDYKNKTRLPLTKEGSNYYLVEEFDKYIQIPTGLLPKLLKYFKTIPIEYTLHKQITVTLLDKKPYSSSLRKDQIQCVDKYIKYKRGILKAYTRYGKTFVLANFINQFSESVNRLIVVPGKDPMYQMRKDISRVLEIPEDSIGLIGDSHFNPQPITVAIPDTLASRIGNLDNSAISYLQSVKVVCFDEIHDHNNPTSLVLSDYLTEAEYKVGCSATPYTAPFLILEAITGEVLLEFSEQDGIKNKVIDAPTITFHKLAKKVDLPTKLNNFKFSGEWTNKEMFLYNQLKTKLICLNSYRNELGVNIVLNRINEGRVVLVLVDRVGTSGGVNHAQIIRDLLLEKGIDFPIVHGKTKKREYYYQQLEDKTLKGIIGSAGILTQAITIRAISSLVLLCGGSEKKALWDSKEVKSLVQRIGRVLTKDEGKLAPTIDDILDCQHVFASQAESRYKAAVATYGKENVVIK
jgi:superfamily II DNA or RNA helicase